MPSYSIIIPLYNAERYLTEHRGSFINENFEFILVDDGSIDKSAEICDEIAGENNNVVVIHQRNQGAAAARKQGLRVARGKWVCFFDIDDEWESTAFSEIERITKDTQADLIVLGFNVRTETDVEHIEVKDALYSRNNFGEYIVSEVIAKRHGNGFFWNKIYRRDIASQVDFETDFKIMEDEVFNQEYLKYCNSIQCSSLCYYTYRIENPNNSRGKCIENYYRIVERVDQGFLMLIDQFPVEDEELRNEFHEALYFRRHRCLGQAATYYLFHPDSTKTKAQRKQELDYISSSNIFKECILDNRPNTLETKLYYWCIAQKSIQLLNATYNVFSFARKVKSYLK